jgi:hypothetical protein
VGDRAAAGPVPVEERDRALGVLDGAEERAPGARVEAGDARRDEVIDGSHGAGGEGTTRLG